MRAAEAPLRVHAFFKRTRARAFTSMVRRGFLEFGSTSSVAAPASLWGAPFTRVGAGAVLGPHCNLWVVGHPQRGTTRIEIGDRVSVTGFLTVSAAERITIEDDVLFARFVYVSDHDHAFEDPTRPVKDQGITGIAPVTIEAGSWLGEGVVVTPGVRIGRGAVIGAGSVVTRDVPAHSLAVGAPARVVRSWAPDPVPATDETDRSPKVAP